MSTHTVRTVTAHALAFAAGFRDGYAQPYELNSTTNVEWLLHRHRVTRPIAATADLWAMQNTLDRGATFGQVVRAPRTHQYA